MVQPTHLVDRCLGYIVVVFIVEHKSRTREQHSDAFEDSGRRDVTDDDSNQQVAGGVTKVDDGSTRALSDEGRSSSRRRHERNERFSDASDHDDGTATKAGDQVCFT